MDPPNHETINASHKYSKCDDRTHEIPPCDEIDKLNEGLIFVKKCDHVSQLFMAITKQEFSSIGIFYKSESSGETVVLLREVDGIKRPGYLYSGMTLDDLTNDPLTDSVYLRRLKPVLDEHGCPDLEATEDRRTCFRTSSINISNKCPHKPITEFIYQLFGHRIPKETGGYTAVEMVNKIIDKMGNFDDFKQGNTKTSIEIPASIETDNVGKVKALSTFASSLNQKVVFDPNVANKRLSSYLEKSEIFDDLEKVEVSETSDITKLKALNDSSIRLKPFMKSFITTLIDLFFGDNDFCKTMISGFNETLDDRHTTQKKASNLLLCCSDQNRELLNLIFSFICNSRVDIHALIQADKDYTNLKAKIEKLLGKSIGPGSNLKLPCSKRIILYAPKKRDVKQLIHAVGGLRDIFYELSNNFINGSNSEVGLNDMIGKLNIIITCFNFKGIPTLSPVEEKACTPATLCTGGNNLKLTLKGNKKICLSCSHPDLGCYGHEELHQIMYAINTIQCKNNKFAHLKKCVSDKLSEHSQCKSRSNSSHD